MPLRGAQMLKSDNTVATFYQHNMWFPVFQRAANPIYLALESLSAFDRFLDESSIPYDIRSFNIHFSPETA